MGNSDFYFYLLIVLGLLFFLVVPVQWIINFYYGVKGAMISGVLLSLLIAFGAQFFYQWGKGVGSVTGYVSYAPGELRMVFASIFLGGLLLIAFTSFGIYHLVQLSKTGVLNKPWFFTWLVLYIGTPTLYIGGKEYLAFLASKEQLTYFVPAYIDVSHYRELPVYIDELKFMNSTNGRASTFSVTAVSEFSIDSVLESEEKVREMDHLLIDRRESIPVEADQFVLSWYSFVEETYYSDTFPFPAGHFPIKNWPDGSRTMRSINLLILPEGKVRLFGPGNKQYFPYHKVEVKPLSQEEKNQKIEAFYAVNQGQASKEDIRKTLQEIKNSDRLNKREAMDKMEFNWGLTIEGEGEISSVNISDFRQLRYDTTYQWLHKPGKKVLPSEITMYFSRQQSGDIRVYLFPDKEKLFDQVEALTAGNSEMEVEFLIKVAEGEENNISFQIRAGERAIDFASFGTNVVRL
ncbi:hypothetical protein GCM10009122_52860 [Fulvivirga kasyanovii]|uniref:CvpA family protein n=1 Tax=Fulvivirga kasyanovii TaxID=396812 RepID=A0ABW9RJL7_9BACT|nr:hypothetical protein [Fulvivirga kasyanovii]MTI24279.1 hypothetical protein [Fulvivirga kasyanovii]